MRERGSWRDKLLSQSGAAVRLEQILAREKRNNPTPSIWCPMTRDVGRTYPLPLPSPLPLPLPLPVPIPSPLPLPLPVPLPFHIPLPFSLYRFPCTTIGFMLTLVAALTIVFAFKIHRKYSHIGTGKLSLLSTPAIIA